MAAFRPRVRVGDRFGESVRSRVRLIVGLLLGGSLAWVEIRDPELGPWPAFVVVTGALFGLLVWQFHPAWKRRWFQISWIVLLVVHTVVVGRMVLSAGEWHDEWFLELGVVELLSMAVLLALVRRRVRVLRPEGSGGNSGSR